MGRYECRFRFPPDHGTVDMRDRRAVQSLRRGTGHPGPFPAVPASATASVAAVGQLMHAVRGSDRTPPGMPDVRPEYSFNNRGVRLPVLEIRSAEADYAVAARAGLAKRTCPCRHLSYNLVARAC